MRAPKSAQQCALQSVFLQLPRDALRIDDRMSLAIAMVIRALTAVSALSDSAAADQVAVSSTCWPAGRNRRPNAAVRANCLEERSLTCSHALAGGVDGAGDKTTSSGSGSQSRSLIMRTMGWALLLQCTLVEAGGPRRHARIRIPVAP